MFWIKYLLSLSQSKIRSRTWNWCCYQGCHIQELPHT